MLTSKNYDKIVDLMKKLDRYELNVLKIDVKMEQERRDKEADKETIK